MTAYEEVAGQIGVSLFGHQLEFLQDVEGMGPEMRACLYFKTGAGKSLTAMMAIAVLDYERCLVVAPPSTHPAWLELGDSLGIEVTAMSHAKFRMKTTKVSRDVPLIADEFHMFGGHKGQGWRKLDGVARGLKAPVLLLSATPNYNDAERCYCVQHILSPHVTKGGYLQFLYENCTTEQNPFGMEPEVTGFKDYPDAAHFLADQPRVYYLEDDLEYDIVDLPYSQDLPDELVRMGYDRRKHRMVASLMEMRHTSRYQGLVDSTGHLRYPVGKLLMQEVRRSGGGLLVYADHATVARAASKTLAAEGFVHDVVTGSTSAKEKEAVLARVVATGGLLVGTASLATGTDGLDRMFDTLLILDDTDDDALRRQLVGRIMPRGGRTSAVVKRVLRLRPV